jgi:signal transduction histidine kinase
MADSAFSRIKRLSPPVPRNKRSIRESSPSRGKLAQGKKLKQKRAQTADLLIAQSKVLETLSGDTPLKEMLAVFAETIERQSKGMLCSVLLLDGKTLHHAAAPSLPDAYTRAIDGATIGPRVGSCGTAAFTKKQIIVSDIKIDPLWADYRDLALRHGLRACWSTPILRKNGEVLGTFALYYRTPRTPNKHELRLIANWTRLASLGIKRKLAQESLEAEQRLLQDLFRAQEYERKLTAYELHDGIAQYAAGAIMHLESYVQTHNDESTRAELEIVDHLLHKTLEESRRLINGLRPPILDERGVVAAIKHLIHEPSMAGPQITFDHDATFPRLAPVLEAAIFRIAQETLNNAKRHSGSPKIEVILKRNKNRIHLVVRDWGKGFTPTRISKESQGLRGIRERGRLLGGLIAIDSAPGKGTSIFVDLPFLRPTDVP